jgi:hypothetical protein
VKIGPVQVLVEACILQGKRYDVHPKTGQVVLAKEWEYQPWHCAIQTCLKDLHIHTDEEEQITSIMQLFPAHSECFLLTNPHYGSMAKVLSIDMQKNRVRVKATVLPEPDFGQIRAHEDVMFCLSVYLCIRLSLCLSVCLSVHFLALGAL